MYWKTKKTEWLYGCGIVVSVHVVHSCDHLADWELMLILAAQHDKRGSYCITASLGRDQNSKLQVRLLLSADCFRIIIKPKNHTWNPLYIRDNLYVLLLLASNLPVLWSEIGLSTITVFEIYWDLYHQHMVYVYLQIICIL